MSSYHSFVAEFAALLESMKSVVPERKRTRNPMGPPGSMAPVALLFSPHPDDECITGLLPLRLAAECGWYILNVPVTFGSDPERQNSRYVELVSACDYLDWNLAPSPPSNNGQPISSFGFEDIRDVLRKHPPSAVFLPHHKDWNSRHVSTHELVMDALRSKGSDCSCSVVETEFWSTMDDPNLMVEASVKQLGDLVTALSFHAGEVERNPYHLRLPSWMVDNVRRGAELVCGQGKTGPDFTFATLYRVSHWDGQNLTPHPPRTLSASESPADLFSI